jgi:hypothetical protein
VGYFRIIDRWNQWWRIASTPGNDSGDGGSKDTRLHSTIGQYVLLVRCCNSPRQIVDVMFVVGTAVLSTAVKPMAFKTFDQFKQSDPTPIQLPLAFPNRVEPDLKEWCAIWAKPPKPEDDENTKYHDYFRLVGTAPASLLIVDVHVHRACAAWL